MRIDYLTILTFLLLAPTTNAQLHDDNALFRNSVRRECYERYRLNPCCGTALELWMDRIDELAACQINYGKMIARSNAALCEVAGLPDGFEIDHFGNPFVTSYIVPQNEPFDDFDLHKYPTLCASLESHRFSGLITMLAYIQEIEQAYAAETFHRALLGKPPAMRVNRPVFRRIP